MLLHNYTKSFYYCSRMASELGDFKYISKQLEVTWNAQMISIFTKKEISLMAL